MASADLPDLWDHLDWLEPLASLDVRCDKMNLYTRVFYLFFVYWYKHK